MNFMTARFNILKSLGVILNNEVSTMNPVSLERNLVKRGKRKSDEGEPTNQPILFHGIFDTMDSNQSITRSRNLIREYCKKN